MGKGKGGCTGLGGGEGGWSLEALSEEPEKCFGELKLAEEGFDILFMVVKFL